MDARIYQQPKNAMQSGMANTRLWILEYTPSQPRRIDPLMGWTGSGDMQRQLRLRFHSKEDAVDYARRHGIACVVEQPKPRRANVRPMGYGGNFAYNRRFGWTH
ncbi:MAG TPA: ETC complex I subunit [Thermohalobaculum sp.]|nr:ETC complex I subunit [Thermohalobaculum sp.]